MTHLAVCTLTLSDFFYFPQKKKEKKKEVDDFHTTAELTKYHRYILLISLSAFHVKVIIHSG